MELGFSISRWVIIVINIIFTLFFFVVSGLTIRLLVSPEAAEGFFNNYIVPQLPPPRDPEEDKLFGISIIQLLSPVCWGLLILSIFGIIICTLGFVGAVTRNIRILGAYTILHSILIIVEIGIIIAYFSYPEQFLSWVKNHLRDAVSEYKSDISKEQSSVTMNVLMHEIGCCGLDNGLDFINSTSFVRDYKINNETLNIHFPVTCCRKDLILGKGTCPYIWNETNSNVHIGCWSKLLELMRMFNKKFGWVFGVICFFQIAVYIVQLILIIFQNRIWQRFEQEWMD